MPIRDRPGERQLDARDVEHRLNDYFVAADADDRLTILRALFAELHDFYPAYGQVALTRARQRPGVALPDAADRIAALDGVEVCYIDLSQADTDRVRKRDMIAALDDIRQNLGDDLLLLVRNRPGDQLHWIHPRAQSGPTPTLQRIVVERGVKQRTAVDQIYEIWEQYDDSDDIRAALDRAFDVEPVAKRFFDEYKRIFDDAEARISGFADDEIEPRRQFVQTLFNRLMFVYFLSRKGWLRLDEETDYLNALLRDYESDEHASNFFRDRLTHLFFDGLNNPDSRDVPFLNGGLFERTELDRRPDVTVPDDAIKPLLRNLFDRFNFTVMESTPFDIEVAVDPEMLGKVFEELVTGRHASGAYYTPRPVVAFMCREALKGYLETKAPQLDPQTIAAFVDRREITAIGYVPAFTLAEALENVSVVDPACGSGAYLLGMMQELVELRDVLFNVTKDPRSLYELKLHIIERNLYGADIDPFAVNIAMLRLWLSLAIEYEGDQPEPLPNLDFKIVQGDSLLGPDPSQIAFDCQIAFDPHTIRQSGLAECKRAYLQAQIAEEKARLRQRIADAEASIGDALTAAQQAEAELDWRIRFAEVVGDGGFDIAIGNPPYAQIRKGVYSAECYPYSEGMDKGKQNLYKLFVERSYQLCKPGGVATFIVQSSLMCDLSATATRTLLLDHTQLRHIIEFPKDAATPSLQIFNSVTQGTCIYHFAKAEPTTKPFGVSIGNDAQTIENPAFAPINSVAIKQLYPDLQCMPLILDKTVHILERLAMDEAVKPLQDYALSFAKGDLIQGVHSKEFSSRVTSVRLLRGKHISRYHVSYDASSEWCNETFRQERAEDNAIRTYLLSQQVTGTTDARRLHVALAHNPPARYLCADTLNKVLLREEGLNKPIMALLNSKLMDWIFRHSSTNNHVQLYQLRQLPIHSLTEPQRLAFESLVDRILDAKDRNPDADTSALEREIDRLVYDLYRLTTDEIAAVEARLG